METTQSPVPLPADPHRTYRDLGVFSGLAALTAPRRADRLPPGPALAAAARESIGIPDLAPSDPRTERRWRADGVDGEEVSWSVGFGPRTRAFLLRPEGADGPLPGVVALHCHGGAKWLGKEKVADGPEGPDPYVAAARAELYSGRAWANELARRGFAVLAHDAFGWGSRRVPPEQMPGGDAGLTGRAYDEAASPYEHTLAKWCGLLGTSFAGVVAGEDLAASAYLRSRPEVDGARIGCAGLSGGGARAAMLGAFDPGGQRAVVIASMMCTYDELIDGSAGSHTWMFQPAGLSRLADWPDLTACRAPAPLLVQYAGEDRLFPAAGMDAADDALRAHYAAAGAADAYTGQRLPGPHRFDAAMQDAAFDWLAEHLA